MYLRFEYIIILFYFIYFFRTISLRFINYNKFINKNFQKYRVIKQKIASLNLFMSWEMFETVTPSRDEIKILVETKDKNIDIYYFIDDNLKKIVKELDITESCYAPLIFRYCKYYFLTSFIVKKLEKKYKDNLKYITFYKITKNADGTSELQISDIKRYRQFIY